MPLFIHSMQYAPLSMHHIMHQVAHANNILIFNLYMSYTYTNGLPKPTPSGADRTGCLLLVPVLWPWKVGDGTPIDDNDDD